ncbi:class I SAM-dependent methyltransferase, partial [Candidatus Bathyarchaeota archaeon]|nr:class I SAM-dependent methyltransferase [Candidatus Bathyarchaeota archaeon]
KKEIQELIHDIESLDQSFPRGRALDFGCGVGRLTQSLADHYEEVVGVDIAPSMIELAEEMNRHDGRCRYVLNERDDLRIFGGNHFDLIYSNITLQHMEPRYAFRYIKEFLRVLSTDGILVFHMPSERTGKNTLDYLPRRASAFLQRLMLGGAMEMHGIEKNTLMGFIEGYGGAVLRFKPSDSAGGAWEAYEYFVAKR